jgi:hypothetical protein
MTDKNPDDAQMTLKDENVLNTNAAINDVDKKDTVTVDINKNNKEKGVIPVEKNQKEGEDQKEEEEVKVDVLRPGDFPDEELTVENFLAKNGEQKKLIEARDNIISWKKWIQLLIFVYLLISPIFPMLIDAGDTAWVLVFYLVPLILIIWSFIEYWSRAEIWYCCLCRGIILDMEKTHELGKWACTLPLYFVYFFFTCVTVIWAITYEPKADKDGVIKQEKRYIGAALFLIGILFILSLTKAFVDIEGSPRLLSVNMFIFYLGDVKVLSSRGYKVVHYSQLDKYFNKKDPSKVFSWNDLYQLSHEPASDGVTKWNLTWGCSLANLLRENKDVKC